MNISILGAGSWGTAIAVLLADKGYNINLWSRDLEHVEEMKKTKMNDYYLKDLVLPSNISFYHDINTCVADTKIVVMAVASPGVRETLERIDNKLNEDQVIVNVSKGIENETLKLISDIVEEYFPKNEFCALSGPSHAEEVSKKIPTTIVASSVSRQTAEFIQDVFSTEYLRVYTNPDIIGVEVGGALKNIIALGAGISDGLGFGDNSKAALMTRGIREISRLGKTLGANPLTFTGLTGIGDLIVTCTSMHSRNRRCGILIGEGNSVEDSIKQVGMVVEGIYALKSAYILSQKHDVYMPITHQMYKVIYEDFDPKEAVMNLMTKHKKHEMEEIFEGNTDWK